MLYVVPGGDRTRGLWHSIRAFTMQLLQATFYEKKYEHFENFNITGLPYKKDENIGSHSFVAKLGSLRPP